MKRKKSLSELNIKKYWGNLFDRKNTKFSPKIISRNEKLVSIFHTHTKPLEHDHILLIKYKFNKKNILRWIEFCWKIFRTNVLCTVMQQYDSDVKPKPASVDEFSLHRFRDGKIEKKSENSSANELRIKIKEKYFTLH